MTLRGKIFAVLSPTARSQFLLLGLMCAAAGLVDLVGVGLIVPFVAFAGKMLPFGASSSLLSGTLAMLTRVGCRSEDQIVALGVLFLVGISIANVGICLNQYYCLRVVYQLKAELTARLAELVSRKSMSWFDKQNSADLSRALVTDVLHCLEFVNAGLQIYAISVRSLLIYSFFLLAQPRLAVAVSILLAGSFFLVYYMVHRPLLRAGDIAYACDSQIHRLSSELTNGARTLKVTDSARFVVEDLAKAAERAVVPQIIRNMPGFVTKAFLETFTVGSVIGLLVYFNRKDGNLDNGLPLLSAYALAGVRLVPSIQQALYFVAQMRFFLPSIDRIQSLLDEPIEDEPQIEQSDVTFEREVEVRDLSYGYDEGQAVFSGLSLRIERRQRAALVGETGAGKSTLIDLLLGLRQPNSGEILVDGSRLDLSTRKSWRRKIGYVPQNIYLRDASITENVAFGIPAAETDLAKVIVACQVACIDEFIQTLPDGYATQVGERGVRLSGGQCQRLGIARALYYDPEVVVFDEATSALDNLTEANVLKALDSLRGKKTLIVVAHRLNTIWDFDQIFVLGEGKLLAQGTSRELLNSCPAFQQLATSQKVAG